jgi:hypothetical protein
MIHKMIKVANIIPYCLLQQKCSAANNCRIPLCGTKELMILTIDDEGTEYGADIIRSFVA